MRPPDRFDPRDPREWLNRARSNLVLAKRREPGVYLEDLCFECQQAAEKALKGLILSRGGEFPYVHDLDLLMALLDDVGVIVPTEARRAVDLTVYAVAGRYPGPARPITASEYETAVELAESVVRWAETTLGNR